MDHGASSYRRFLDGAQDAFDGIVMAYYDPLVAFLKSYVGEDVAEDLAMDVFAYVWAFPKRYDFRSSIKTYLFMLGRSRALNYLKSAKHRHEVPLEEAMEIPASESSVEQTLLAGVDAQLLRKAMQKLPEKLRTVLHLTYYADLSAAEAAVVMKTNVKKIYNLLYLAKQALRTLLKQEELL